jgi:hypothetical protein
LKNYLDKNLFWGYNKLTLENLKMTVDNKRIQKEQEPDGKTPGIFVYKAPGEQPSKAAYCLSLPGCFYFRSR